MTTNWANQTIWTGDNLSILRGMNSESVDLIYLDPPFNSNANYAAPIGSKATGAEFKDTWKLSDVDAEWINLMEAKHPALHRVLLAAMTNSDIRDELGMFYDGANRTDIPKRTDLGDLPPPHTHKQTFYGQQEGNCTGCAEHFQARNLEVDHIIARSKGGTDHIGNLQLLCGSCNRIKGDRGMEYLRVKLQL